MPTRDILPQHSWRRRNRPNLGCRLRETMTGSSPSAKKKKTLGQRLARTVAESTSIDTTSGTGHTEWVKLKTFLRSKAPFARDKDERVLKAKKHTDGVGEISFCTDRSRMDSGRTGASVAWCDLNWKARTTYLGINKEMFDAELYAIGEALKIALRNGRTGREPSRMPSEPPWTRINIWADSQVTIKRLQHNAPSPGQ